MNTKSTGGSADRNARGGDIATIVVVGASGDLAQKKILPALFALHSQGFLPPAFNVFGFARSPMTDEEFRAKAMEHLTCRYVPAESCAEHMDAFLSRCYYVAGQYNDPDSFLDLYQRIAGITGARQPSGIFYMALPPSVYVDVALSLGNTDIVQCGSGEERTRVVIEKPFGRDRESSDALARTLADVFSENQTYRIDHYLGKEVIQDLIVLRFANLVFEPLWNRSYIHSVEISWQEDIGVEDRGRYFDDYGIIRDVMQNHLLQILALIAMEMPNDLSANAVRDEKVAVLSRIPPLRVEDLVVGQYRAARTGGAQRPSYLEEKYIPPDSITPTYASAVLHVNNPRWEGVPFLIKAGKALDSRMTEIRIRFRALPRNLFCQTHDCLRANELVLRVQPDEAIQLRFVNKVPGVTMTLADTELNLRYQSAFHRIISDAYERLLLDVIHGDKSLFIRGDELGAAWDIFTPALHQIDQQRTAPLPYEFGSAGPAAAAELAGRHNIPMSGERVGPEAS